MSLEAISGERGLLGKVSVSDLPTAQIDQIFSHPVGVTRAMPGRRTHFPAGQATCPIPHLRLATKTSKDLARVTGFASEEQYTVATWMFARLTQTLYGNPNVFEYANETPATMRDESRLQPLSLSDRILHQLDQQPQGQKDVALAVRSGIFEAYDVFLHLNGNLSTAMKNTFNYLASDGTRAAYVWSRVGHNGEWPIDHLPMDFYAMLHDQNLTSVSRQTFPTLTEQQTERDCLGRVVADTILEEVATAVRTLPSNLKKQYYIPYMHIPKKYRNFKEALAFEAQVRLRVAQTADAVHGQIAA